MGQILELSFEILLQLYIMVFLNLHFFYDYLT